MEENIQNNQSTDAILAVASKKSKTKNAKEGILTLDVYQTENEIIIKSTIAGVSPKDLDISITEDTVTIKGERKREEEAKTSDYYYQELYYGTFSRSVILPEEIDVDKAKASFKNGMLTIRLPKLAKTKTKKLKVG